MDPTITDVSWYQLMEDSEQDMEQGPGAFRDAPKDPFAWVLPSIFAFAGGYVGDCTLGGVEGFVFGVIAGVAVAALVRPALEVFDDYRYRRAARKASERPNGAHFADSASVQHTDN